MLRLENVETYYGNIKALKGVSLEVPEGRVVTILGANGAGKTTVLRTISGVTPASAGRIELLGQRIDRMPPERIVELGISHVPEGRQIFPELTVRENLMMGAYARRDNEDVRKDLDRVASYFPVLGERHAQKGGTLSGGEQQMLAIARALMSRPKLLLLDEPSLGLAPIVVKEIFRIIRAINQEGTTILLVEQNVRIALSVASYGYVLETGKVPLSDTTANLLRSDLVVHSYLGKHGGSSR